MSKKRKNIETDEINPYEIDKLSKIPSWIIIVFLKYWAAAAAVFFTIIGGLDIGFDFSSIDSDNLVQTINTTEKMIVIIAVAIAALMNYAVKQIVILLNNRRNNTYKYNLVNQTGMIGLVLQLLYALLMSTILYFLISYLGYKGWVINLFGTSDYGIEPFTYGLCYVIIDIIFVLIKNGIYQISERLKYKKQLAMDL